MRNSYQIAGKSKTGKLPEYLARNGQLLLPMVELIEKSRLAVDELIDDVSRSAVEAVLILSAISVAGEKSRGKKGGEIGWHGSQKGSVRLSNKKILLKKPRLRKKCRGPGGEVEIPAYEAINGSDRLCERIGEILMRGVSTRNYEAVIGEMADTVGVKKSSVSREFIRASAKDLERLLERRFDDVDLLVIYLDGLVFGGHHILCAVGVDSDGRKHVLGLAEGASENASSATSLLENMVERGVDSSKRYLFVIDGSKALRKAIDKVFGEQNPVQRCRNHKVKNVCDKLPGELQDQVKAAMKAAYRLPWKKGIARLKKQAEWLKNEHPGAAGSLLEGLEETFTINRLELSPSLRQCLGTTNIIESPYSGVRQKTRRVTRWKDGRMVLRWASSALLATEKKFRRIMGYKDLWMLKAVLRDTESVELVDREEEIA